MNRTDLYVLVGFFFFLLLFFLPILMLPGDVCLGRLTGDAWSQFYGWRAYGFGEIRQGRFPLWNPYEFLGMPFVGSLQSAMFYPMNWLCAFLPLGFAINLGIFLNLFLSGLFTYLWVRRLGIGWVGAIIASVAYVFGAPQWLRIYEGHWSFLASMPWIPCLLLCAEELVVGGRRRFAVASGAIAVALQLFGGNPQYAFYGGIAVVIYLAIRLLQERKFDRRNLFLIAGGFAAMYLLGSIIAAVQLLPAIELLLRSSRKGQLSYDWIADYSFVPENILTFIAPAFFGSDIAQIYWGRYNLWEMSAYVGVVVLALAFIGAFRGRRKIAVVALWLCPALFLLALGGHTPLLRLFYRFVPGFNLFRAVSRFLCPFSLFLALLAALGAQAVLDVVSDPDVTVRRRWSGRLAWGVLAVALLIAVAALALSPPQWSRVQEVWTERMGRWVYKDRNRQLPFEFSQFTPVFAISALTAAGMSLARAAALLGGLGGGILICCRLRGQRRWAVVLLLGLVGVDAWTFCGKYLLTFDPRTAGLTPEAVKFLKQSNAPFRYARGASFNLPPAEGMAHELACIEGVQPNAPDRFRGVFWAFQGQSPHLQKTSYAIHFLDRSFRMFNLRYLVKYCSDEDKPHARTVFQDERVRVEELPNPWPRAWLVHRYEVVRNHNSIPAKLRRWPYETVALFEEEPDFIPAEPTGVEQFPRIFFYQPGRVGIELNASAAGFLILSDLHYPGWGATVDGHEKPILRANYLMRAVAVPAGPHIVEFTYRPASFRNGIALSVLGCVILCGIIGLAWRRRLVFRREVR